MNDRCVRLTEDMSPNGYLELLWRDDGDVIVVVAESRDDDAVEVPRSVEFCCPGYGGGHWERTHAALVALFHAMRLDLEESR